MAVHDLQSLLNDINQTLISYEDRGVVADYIPELAKQDSQSFGMTVATVDGQVLSVGDTDVPFSIQSISKVFVLTMALGKIGDTLWKRVGREPSGSAFNSIVQLEHEKGIPRNPFINAGAIVTTDVVLAGHKPKETIGEILRFVRGLVNEDAIYIDEHVARSETQTGYRNAALANYMRAFGNLDNPVEEVLGVYFHQCAIAMSCSELARAGLYLANGGVNPQGGIKVIPPRRVRRINAIMMTCGHYDGSGDFAFRVGLPGKSGVGGGILAIVPNKAAIAVWSPGLDTNGNSKLGTVALEILVAKTGWSVFGA
ncbi:MAG: glutaminase [Rhodobacteraceae bacterium]|nr:glutaminase [Paracoccaceae bacterium]